MPRSFLLIFLLGGLAAGVPGQIAVRGEIVHTMAGEPLKDGVVLIKDGKIQSVGLADALAIPGGYEVLRAKVVTPGLIDAHSVVGLTGYLNQDQDQDQLDKNTPIQPELRAVDSYNPREHLVGFVRSLGVTTLHTGHAPGALLSGQTMVVKTAAPTVGAAVLKATAMLACTLDESAKGASGKSPGTRSKAVAMLRARLIDAQEYLAKREGQPADKKPGRDLGLEMLGRVLKKELPLLITVHRASDIATTLRLAEEFKIKVVLDGAAEAYLVTDAIQRAGVTVIVHPPMMRTRGDRENATMELASLLDKKGIPILFQSGFESYVPKTRVVLFEAAIAAAHGLGPEKALRALTIDAARFLGLSDRIGSLEPGKDADLALYDGDPFEYTSHCTGVLIDGRIVSRLVR